MNATVLARSCLGLLIAASVTSTVAVPGTFSHDDWTTVLSRFVDENGLVDYEGLARDRATFDRYVKRVETIGPETDPQLFPDRDHELAYYINGYNALVFQGVLDLGPEQESVWKGGLVSGYGFFVGKKVTIGGRRTNLKKLEDKTIRAGFEDPRIHAALNCASLACPRLPQEAFDPARLDGQLDAAMREFVNDERHVQVDDAAGKVRLSKIFDWFRADFIDHEAREGNDDPTLIDYINRYRPVDAPIPASYKVEFNKYDKGINRQP